MNLSGMWAIQENNGPLFVVNNLSYLQLCLDCALESGRCCLNVHCLCLSPRHGSKLPQTTLHENKYSLCSELCITLFSQTCRQFDMNKHVSRGKVTDNMKEYVLVGSQRLVNESI